VALPSALSGQVMTLGGQHLDRQGPKLQAVDDPENKP